MDLEYTCNRISLCPRNITELLHKLLLIGKRGNEKGTSAVSKVFYREYTGRMFQSYLSWCQTGIGDTKDNEGQ